MRSTCLAFTQSAAFWRIADRRICLARFGRPRFRHRLGHGKDGVHLHRRQVWIQAKAVGVSVLLSAVVSVVALFIVKAVVGLRVPEDEEREGLDVTSHGEKAYN